MVTDSFFPASNMSGKNEGNAQVLKTEHLEQFLMKLYDK